MKKDVYRKAALERLATVDQLDRIMKISSPLSWLALLGVTLIVVAVVVWSFIGTLPATITANGIIVSSTTSTNTVLSQQSGTVEMLVNEGDYIGIGQEIARITQGNVPTFCLSNQYGYVGNMLVADGTAVEQGTELIRVRPYLPYGQKHVAVCYVPVSDVEKLATFKEKDMIANITLTSADSSSYGHMEGRVINVDSWATSNKGIEAVVGTDNNLSSMFVKETGVCAVTCELLMDPDEADSKNDYYWSNQKGKQILINDKMMCSVKIITENERPITKLFTKLKDILEGKE